MKLETPWVVSHTLPFQGRKKIIEATIFPGQAARNIRESVPLCCCGCCGPGLLTEREPLKRTNEMSRNRSETKKFLAHLNCAAKVATRARPAGVKPSIGIQWPHDQFLWAADDYRVHASCQKPAPANWNWIPAATIELEHRTFLCSVLMGGAPPLSYDVFSFLSFSPHRTRRRKQVPGPQWTIKW